MQYFSVKLHDITTQHYSCTVTAVRSTATVLTVTVTFDRVLLLLLMMMMRLITKT